MLITLIFSLMFMINIMFSMMLHPLAITLLIVIQTTMICSTTGTMSYTFWFSYILFMVFLGGMLVLFIYITSLASNEEFKLPTKTMMVSGLFFMMMTMMITTTPYTINLMTNNTNKHDSISLLVNTTTEPINLNQLYNFPNMNMVILSISYLLFTLIVIVKITQIHEGPLRPSN